MTPKARLIITAGAVAALAALAGHEPGLQPLARTRSTGEPDTAWKPSGGKLAQLKSGKARL